MRTTSRPRAQPQPGLRDLPLPSVTEARAYVYDAEEEQLRLLTRARQIIGGPEHVGRALRALVGASGADEVMVTAGIHDHAERKRSYDRILTALAGINASDSI